MGGLLRGLNRAEEVVVCALLAAASLLACTQVFMRYSLGQTLPWAEELTITMLIWSGLIGSSLALRRGVHIGVDVFVQKFPRRVAKALTLLALTLGLGFTVTLAVLSARLVAFLSDSGQMSIELNIPMWIPYLCLPITFVLMSLRFAQVIARCWRDEDLFEAQISQAEIR